MKVIEFYPHVFINIFNFKVSKASISIKFRWEAAIWLAVEDICILVVDICLYMLLYIHPIYNMYVYFLALINIWGNIAQMHTSILKRAKAKFRWIEYQVTKVFKGAWKSVLNNKLHFFLKRHKIQVQVCFQHTYVCTYIQTYISY